MIYRSPREWQEGEIPVYAFCESVFATGKSPWHIRKVGLAGLKLGGGIDTPSLCLRVKPFGVESGTNGWDLSVRITDDHLEHACKGCVGVYRTETKT